MTDTELGFAYRVVDHYDSYMIQRFSILRETDKGFWIRLPWEFKERWVANEGRNNFAKRSKDDALENYYHRKVAHVRHLKQTAELAKRRLERVKVDLGKESGSRPDIFSIFHN